MYHPGVNLSCSLRLFAIACLLSLSTAACEADDPTASGPTSGGGGATAGCDADSSVAPLDGPGCVPLADDYTPREQGSATDSWPACISDDNGYHPFGASISSNARTGAFEEIAALLHFGEGIAPTAQEFLDARVV